MDEPAIWTCKIGFAQRQDLPEGADGPLRNAVQRAFKDVIGEDALFCFSGWAGELDEIEGQAVIQSMNNG